jgi:hypothetical protein
MSRWLHPVGAAAWSSWLLPGAVLLGWGAVFLASLDVSPTTSALLWAASALSAVTLPSAVVQTHEPVSAVCNGWPAVSAPKN